MSGETRWCFDTGVFVTPMLRNLPESAVHACLEWQARAASGAISAVTSTLTWDEVVWVAGRRRSVTYDFAAAAQAGAALRALPTLHWAAVDEETLRVAQLLLAKAHLRPRDALHAATALLHAEGRLLTLDGDFPAGLRLAGLPALRPLRLFGRGG